MFYDTISGTPQGGIISPVLANLRSMASKSGFRGVSRLRAGVWRGKTAQVHLIRYADDFVITANSLEILVDRVKPLVEAFLAERGLVLSPEKTLITHVSEGFDFLGQNVRRYPNGKLLIKPSRKAFAHF
ncbi:RNA-directed DNA polymerase [Nitrosovibrio tenuis]|uniref:RNA-directed DNA polymerase n=2 Tax=Nitrosovibrio tenuis TaxID=1233 RepID=A0A1H7PXI5_9PROT|nr:RNA-directed DNA polymerase [Nitrosovibrio tenuis]